MLASPSVDTTKEVIEYRKGTRDLGKTTPQGVVAGGDDSSGTRKNTRRGKRGRPILN